ncbi:hypothetical protein B0H14DRAFT_2371816, partial [Mycena olivaceomarginata]
FSTRSDRFMDAYRKGLNGLQAAWAGKRYRGHRVLPKNIMALLDRLGRNIVYVYSPSLRPPLLPK